MAPPSYLPRVHMRTGSVSFSSSLRRFASSTQCEQFGLTSVSNASGLTTSFGSAADATTPAERRRIKVRMEKPRSERDRGIVSGYRVMRWWGGDIGFTPRPHLTTSAARFGRCPPVGLQLAIEPAGHVRVVALVDLIGRDRRPRRGQLDRFDRGRRLIVVLGQRRRAVCQ